MRTLLSASIDFETNFRASPNAYLLLTPDLVIVTVNAAYEKLVGRNCEALAKRNFFDAFPGQESQHVRQLRGSFAYVLETSQPHTLPLLHYPVLREDGSWEDRYWSVTISPLFDAKGNTAMILNHVQDVTELLRNNPLSGESEPDLASLMVSRQVNAALEAERRRIRQLMEQAPGFVAVGRGRELVFELANKAYYQLVGHREILGKPVREALPELEGQGFLELLDNAYTSGKPFIGRAMPIQVQHEPGAELVERYIDFIYQPIFEPDGSVSGIFVQGHDVTEAHNLSREISHQAAHDSLTGLINRREFEDRLNLALEKLEHGQMHSLLYLDLDQFKVVNDTCGHSAGDELLRQIGKLLKYEVRGGTLARLGGDEFALLLERCSSQEAERIANALRESINDVEFAWGHRVFGCSVSIGVTSFDCSRDQLADILSAADAACFLAKEKGRNRVQVHRLEDDELASRRREMDWVSRLRSALQENRLLLYAQRIEPLHEEFNETCHAEVLVRLRETDGTIVPPMAFIPAAERYGLMPLVDRYVIRAAFRYIAELPPTQRARTTLAVNLSGTTLNDEGFLPFIETVLKETGITAETISFEVTETTAVANLTQTAALMHELKSMGFGFSLDDFGSGMSSFGYLKMLPVDRLKIDGIFIKHILEDQIDSAMVRAIAQVAEVMGIQTVAEYVENDDIRQLLVRLGVDYAQGYGVHKPEPLEELAWQHVSVT